MDGIGTHRRPRQESRQTPPTRPLAGLDRLLTRAETEIALLRRCHPTNATAECARAAANLRRGGRLQLEFHYPAPPQLGALRAALAACQQSLDGAGEVGRLYAARAGELELEAALAEHIGMPGFSALARQRHAVGTEPDWERAQALAEAWTSATAPAEKAPVPEYLSDDRNAAASLVSVLSRSVGELALPVRILIVAEQASRAATADGVIFVRAGERLSAARAEGIAAHEVLGHALPRVRARSHALGLYRFAAQGAGEDEEGRAIAIEDRLGWLGAERGWELGARHLGALAVAAGADADDVVRLLVARGGSIETALRLYTRIARGGGLCRELTYLPAWQRVRRALHEDPELEDWLARGRLSLNAARTLRSLDARANRLSSPSEVPSTGA